MGLKHHFAAKIYCTGHCPCYILVWSISGCLHTVKQFHTAVVLWKISAFKIIFFFFFLHNKNTSIWVCKEIMLNNKNYNILIFGWSSSLTFGNTTQVLSEDSRNSCFQNAKALNILLFLLQNIYNSYCQVLSECK